MDHEPLLCPFLPCTLHPSPSSVPFSCPLHTSPFSLHLSAVPFILTSAISFLTFYLYFISLSIHSLSFFCLLFSISSFHAFSFPCPSPTFPLFPSALISHFPLGRIFLLFLPSTPLFFCVFSSSFSFFHLYSFSLVLSPSFPYPSYLLSFSFLCLLTSFLPYSRSPFFSSSHLVHLPSHPSLFTFSSSLITFLFFPFSFPLSFFNN